MAIAYTFYGFYICSMGRFIYFVVGVLSTSPVCLSAQSREMGFEQISLEHGLSQAAVFAIAQDQQGFMWFGTLDGLNKYDGYEINVYKNDPRDTTSLSENKITVFCVDGAGTLWIGTQNGGLNAFNRERETFTRYLHVASNSNSLSDNRVREIYADASGVLWIATFAHALDKLDPRTERSPIISAIR